MNVALFVIASLLFACGREDTLENFDGREYPLSNPPSASAPHRNTIDSGNSRGSGDSGGRNPYIIPENEDVNEQKKSEIYKETSPWYQIDSGSLIFS